MKIVGIKHQTGEYLGNNYDNYRLFVTDPTRVDTKEFGVCPSFVKVKASLMHEIVAPDNVASLIGKDVNFFYDAYQNVVKIDLM